MTTTRTETCASRHLRLVERRRRPQHVLIVDEDPFALATLAEMLRSFGVTNVTRAIGAASAIDGVDWIEGAPALILCSAALSNSDGFSLLTALNRIGFAGAIVLTADFLNVPPVFQLAHFQHLDVVGTLRKPFNPATLGALLASFD